MKTFRDSIVELIPESKINSFYQTGNILEIFDYLSAVYDFYDKHESEIWKYLKACYRKNIMQEVADTRPAVTTANQFKRALVEIVFIAALEDVMFPHGIDK